MKTIVKFLPSRTVMAIFIIPIFAIIIFFIFTGLVITPEKKKESASQNFVKALENELSNRDADEDGLMDWEERLYKTDPANSDSDGDGSLDGLEVRVGTDPLDPLNLKSKNKKNIENVADEYYYKNDPNLSMTDVLARDFFVKTMELKEANLMGNISARENLAEELLNENNLVLENKFTLKDLNIVKNKSVKGFKKSYGDMLKKYAVSAIEEDYYLFGLYMDTKEDIYIDKLKNNLKMYREIEFDLLKVEVAESGATLYLEYVNILGKYVDSVEKLTKVETDPVAALSIVQYTQEIDEKMKLVSRSLQLYFLGKNI